MTIRNHTPGGEPQQADPGISFGRRLRAARLARGMSQEQLGQEAGLDRTYISGCEAGRRNVTMRTLGRLADALGVHPIELIADPDELARLVDDPSLSIAADPGDEYEA